MNVLMTGGTGFLGSALRTRLEQEGHSITCLSRTRTGDSGATRFVPVGSLAGLEPHEAVVNLAGESVVGLWTASKRRAIYRSRVELTQSISAWIDGLYEKPKVFLSGSAVGIYGDAGDRELTEKTDVSSAGGFLAKVCRDWEHAASSTTGVRTVLLRTGHVLDPSGGYLKKVLPIYRRFPIVVLGPRSAYFPWIALTDWIDLVLFALTNDSIVGPLNVVGPNPMAQGDFTAALARKLVKRVWFSVPRWMLRLTAGEFGDSMTYSQRAIPGKALATGFTFEMTTISGYVESDL